jgi:hypothetical protein
LANKLIEHKLRSEENDRWNKELWTEKRRVS